MEWQVNQAHTNKSQMKIELPNLEYAAKEDAE